MNNNGLLATESPSSALTASDGPNCGNGLPAYSFTPQTTTLKGALYYIDQTPDANGNVDLTEQTTVHSGVNVSAYSGSTLLGNGNLFTNGIYQIPNIPVNPDSDYPVVVKFEDTNQVFQDDQILAVVPATAGAETSTGKTQLVTLDGQVCASTDTACISNQSASQGTYTVTLTDSTNNAPVAGVDVELKEGSSFVGNTAQTATTDASGVATFNNVDYGSYTAYVADPNYEIASHTAPLQGATTATTMALAPTDSEYDISLSMNTNTPDADLDFKLYAQNPAGEECEASPLNKYCAYAQHFVDATPNSPGSEIINIKDLAVAKYRTTVEPAPAYQGTCSAMTNSAVNYHDFINWNWNIFKNSHPLTSLPFQFFRRWGQRKIVAANASSFNAEATPEVTNTFGQAAASSPSGLGQNSLLNALFAMIDTPSPVQTVYEANQPSQIINQGGNVLSTPVDASPYIQPNPEEIFEDDPEDPFDESEPIEVTAPEDTSDENETNAGIPSDSDVLNSDEVLSTADIQDSADAPARILEEPAHLQGNSPNYILVDCFTGFGKVSVQRAQLYFAALSSVQDWTYCDNRIAADYNLSALQAAQNAA